MILNGSRIRVYFSNLLNSIFRIKIVADMNKEEKILFTPVVFWGDLFVQQFFCLDMLAWGLKVFTIQKTVMY